jgi:hypothetical protein
MLLPSLLLSRILARRLLALVVAVVEKSIEHGTPVRVRIPFPRFLSQCP